MLRIAALLCSRCCEQSGGAGRGRVGRQLWRAAGARQVTSPLSPPVRPERQRMRRPRPAASCGTAASKRGMGHRWASLRGRRCTIMFVAKRAPPAPCVAPSSSSVCSLVGVQQRAQPHAACGMRTPTAHHCPVVMAASLSRTRENSHWPGAMGAPSRRRDSTCQERPAEGGGGGGQEVANT